MPEFMSVWVVMGANNGNESWIESIHDNQPGAQKEQQRLVELDQARGSIYMMDGYYVEEYKVTDD